MQSNQIKSRLSMSGAHAHWVGSVDTSESTDSKSKDNGVDSIILGKSTFCV